MTFKKGAELVSAARAQKGQAKYRGMCQAFCVLTAGTGAKGDFDGDGDADAVDGWRKARAEGRVVHARDIKSSLDIPAGTIAYWSGGSKGYGHAAITSGHGQVVSTDAPRYGVIGEVNIGWIAANWGMTFLGYIVDDGDGHVFVEPRKPISIKSDRGPVTVTVRRGAWLNGRIQPGKGRVLARRRRGYTFTPDRTHIVKGVRFYRDPANKAWYTTKHLARHLAAK